MEHEKIPTDKRNDVTYGQIIWNYRPQKDEPHWTRLVAECNLISFPGDVRTITEGIKTARILFNITISTKGAQLLCCDIKSLRRDTNRQILIHPIIAETTPRIMIDQDQPKDK